MRQKICMVLQRLTASSLLPKVPMGTLRAAVKKERTGPLVEYFLSHQADGVCYLSLCTRPLKVFPKDHSSLKKISIKVR